MPAGSQAVLMQSRGGAAMHGRDICNEAVGSHVHGPKASVVQVHRAQRNDSNALCLLALQLPGAVVCVPAARSSPAVAAPAASLVPAQAAGPSSEHQPQHYSAVPPSLGCSCRASASDRVGVVVVISFFFALGLCVKIVACAENRRVEMPGLSQLQVLLIAA